MKLASLFIAVVLCCTTQSTISESKQRNSRQSLPPKAGQNQEQTKQPSTSRPQPRKPVDKLFSLAVGNQWAYQLHIPKGAMQIYDPFIIEPSGLLETSATHGQTRAEENPIDATFTIKSSESVSDSSAKVELGIEKRALWFAVKTKEIQMVLSRRLNKLVTLELHAVMDMNNDSKWIIGQELAALPLGAKTEITIGDRTYFAEPLTKSIKVPAGEFSRGFHSVISRKGTDGGYIAPGQRPIPSYKIESWTAEGVGLIKNIMFDAKDNVIYSLELSSFQVK